MDNGAIFLIKIKKDNEAFRGRGVYFLRLLEKNLTAKFVVSCCALCKLRRNFGFFCINHLGGPLSKRMFTCDWCILIHFGCFCVARFDRPVSGNNRSVFYTDFSDLSYSYLTSASCPRQKFHSSSRFPSLFLSGLESFSVYRVMDALGKFGEHSITRYTHVKHEQILE